MHSFGCWQIVHVTMDYLATCLQDMYNFKKLLILTEVCLKDILGKPSLSQPRLWPSPGPGWSGTVPTDPGVSALKVFQVTLTCWFGLTKAGIPFQGKLGNLSLGRSFRFSLWNEAPQWLQTLDDGKVFRQSMMYYLAYFCLVCAYCFIRYIVLLFIVREVHIIKK